MTGEIDPSHIHIVVRVRQTIVRDAYVQVSMSDVLIPREDGFQGIDADRVMAIGLELSSDASVDWQVETQSVELHPIQQPTPKGRDI